MVQYKENYSRSILFQFLILSILAGLVILYNHEFLIRFYIENQATNTGYIVNGSILALFVIGILRIVLLLLRYISEENALARFIKNSHNEHPLPSEHINKRSLIYNRYQSVQEITRYNANVNHSALASTLSASESTRLSLPRFISNILILTGVFGTIISLSIALLGASDIIDSPDGIGGMSIVIHGMSTALSTTATAIVCYLFFGYFYMKLTDVQTELLSGIEQATTLYIMPRSGNQTDNMLNEVGSLVEALHEAADAIYKTQVEYAEAGRSLNAITNSYATQMTRLGADVEEVKAILREGFRLSSQHDSNDTQ